MKNSSNTVIPGASLLSPNVLASHGEHRPEISGIALMGPQRERERAITFLAE